MDHSTTHSGPPLRRAGLAEPGRALSRRAFGWPWRVYMARRLMCRLSELSDVELRDVGLTRLDLQAVRALPLDADPSAALSRLAEERRSARWLALRRADRPPGRRPRHPDP